LSRIACCTRIFYVGTFLDEFFLLLLRSNCWHQFLLATLMKLGVLMSSFFLLEMLPLNNGWRKILNFLVCLVRLKVDWKSWEKKKILFCSFFYVSISTYVWEWVVCLFLINGSNFDLNEKKWRDSVKKGGQPVFWALLAINCDKSGSGI